MGGGAAAAEATPAGTGKGAASNQNTVARAGGPASTSYKVIDEGAVAVPSKLPFADRDAQPRPSGPAVAEAAR